MVNSTLNIKADVVDIINQVMRDTGLFINYAIKLDVFHASNSVELQLKRKGLCYGVIVGEQVEIYQRKCNLWRELMYNKFWFLSFLPFNVRGKVDYKSVAILPASDWETKGRAILTTEILNLITAAKC